MTEHMRVGIVGTSWWADMMYLPSLQSHPQAKIAAICGRNRERAEEMAKKYAIPQVYTDYRELIDEGDIQALVELIHEGYLGRCYDGYFRFAGGFGREARYQWKWDRQRGLGILGDLGAHMIDLAYLCVGGIERVNANLPTFIERPGNEGESLDPTNDSALLMLQFANGAHGIIQTSAVTHVADRLVEQLFLLHGEEGTLEVKFDFGTGYVVRGARHDEEQIKTLPIPDRIMAGLDPQSSVDTQFSRIFCEQSVGSRLFIDAIVEDRAIFPNFHDGLKVQQVIDAAIEADLRGRWISLKG